MSNPFIQTTITCAAPNCGKTKQGSNHWFLAQLHNSHGPTVSVGTWSDVDARQDDVLPLCGDECVIRLVQKYLSDMKVQSQEAANPAKENSQ